MTEGWMEGMRRRWNSRRFRGEGEFRGRALVVIEGDSRRREFMIEMEGWRMRELREPREGERAEICIFAPFRSLRKVRREEDLVWMVIHREVRVRGRFRKLARNLSLWTALLPFLASGLRRKG
jgi:hypothetical protein